MLRFMFHETVHLLNWIEMNLFADMGLELTAIVCSCTDSIDAVRLQQPHRNLKLTS